MTPRFLPTVTNASKHLSMSCALCTAEICTLIRASPVGRDEGGKRRDREVYKEGGREEKRSRTNKKGGRKSNQMFTKHPTKFIGDQVMIISSMSN